VDAYTKGLDPRGRAAVDAAVHGVHTGSRPPVTAFTQGTCGGPFYGRSGPTR